MKRDYLRAIICEGFGARLTSHRHDFDGEVIFGDEGRAWKESQQRGLFS